MLTVHGLAKSFGPRVLFAGVDLRVEPGEAVSIMGASGSGKTTFIRCLNGLERADEGVVTVGGLRLSSRDDARRYHEAALAIRQRLGFVFQGFHLFAHRSVLDNVMEGPVWVKGESPAGVRRRAETLLENVGVGHRAAAFPQHLSGGEQQRVAIARALAMNPEALLLDEPTSALDDAAIESLTSLLRGLVAAGLALVSVTHDGAFARALSQRVLRLDSGQLVAAAR